IEFPVDAADSARYAARIYHSAVYSGASVMPHPLVLQLRFTRSELMRAIEGVSEADAQKRILPMNCISWCVGHLASQEQRYWLLLGQNRLVLPEIHQNYSFGAPAQTPPLGEVVEAWREITTAAD